jgi:deoxyhypusine monooxygenase
MRDSAEDDMVRHEAAEALGGIASEGDEGVEGELYENEEDKQKGVLGILREWSTLESAPPVVRESCQVALDMYEVSRCPPASLRSMAPCSDTDMESVAIV